MASSQSQTVGPSSGSELKDTVAAGVRLLSGADKCFSIKRSSHCLFFFIFWFTFIVGNSTLFWSNCRPHSCIMWQLDLPGHLFWLVIEKKKSLADIYFALEFDQVHVVVCTAAFTWPPTLLKDASFEKIKKKHTHFRFSWNDRTNYSGWMNFLSLLRPEFCFYSLWPLGLGRDGSVSLWKKDSVARSGLRQ